MSGKIIVSAQVLRNLLDGIDFNEVDPEHYLPVRVNNGNIVIYGESIDCETKDFGIYNVQASKLNELNAMLHKIGDQPLTIHFGDYSFITIQSILI